MGNANYEVLAQPMMQSYRSWVHRPAVILVHTGAVMLCAKVLQLPTG